MKRVLALLLALVMLLALTACGKNEKGAPTGESTGATIADTTESTNNSTDGTEDNSQGTTESTNNSTDGTEDSSQGTTESTIGNTTTPTTTPGTTPTEGSKPTENTKPTGGSTPTTTPTEGTKPTENTPPNNTTTPTTGGYKCSCGFTCTECNINDGTCGHYTTHYKDHPAACPHYYNGNPKDNWCIAYRVSIEDNYDKCYKVCNICDTTWPAENHTMVINQAESVAGDCYTSKLTVSECSKCGASVHDYSEGRQHTYGEWVYLTEPCGIFPHYERYCTKCSAHDYRSVEGPVTRVACQGGTATCTEKAICKWCKKPYGSVSTTNHVGATEVRNAKSATCCKGYSGDTYCLACNKLCSKGQDIAPARDHSWQVISTGIYQCKECGAVEIRVGS